ncbi:beta-defensin-like [Crotalus adamanteus]|uniref:Beta-defensin-like n=1 Tax=Crotalus adamanteus TaxID=8729 RepID=A0AAW1BS42_CROAD
MKILYLLFAFLFLAFLSEPGDAQPRCNQVGGFCRPVRCPRTSEIEKDCGLRWKCCKRTRGK